MLRFVAQRLVFILLVFITIVFAVYWGMLLIQRSPVPEQRAGVWEVGGDALIATRQFFTDALRGDLGTYELASGELPITELLRQSFFASMGLLFLASLIAGFVGILLGIIVGVTRLRGVSFSMLTATVIGISVPSFFAAMLLQNWIIVIFREFDRRLLSVAGFGWDYQHLILPILVLSVRPIAYLLRTTSIVLDRTLQEDYVRTAHSKGLSRRYVINIHALRNVAVPILTALGVSWRFSLGILPVVEYMFAWPGLGLRMLEGFQTGQISMVVPLAAIFGLTLLMGNLILDVLYRIVDPRLREAA